MNKFTIGAIAAILLAFGGLVVWSSLNTDNKINLDSYNTAKAIPADENNGNISDHYRGKENADIVVVEYADLQCPGCATMMPKMSKLYKQYGDRIGFIFRSYPIQGHQNARSASAAAEAAGYQGLFWEMIETMYDNRTDWINIFDTEKRTNVYTDLFKKIAGDKGDLEKFKNDLSDANIQKKIDFDKSIGTKRDKVSATPSVYINGEAIDIDNTDEKVETIIEKKLNELLKNANLPTGPAEGATDEKAESDSEEK